MEFSIGGCDRLFETYKAGEEVRINCGTTRLHGSRQQNRKELLGGLRTPRSIHWYEDEQNKDSVDIA